MLLPLQTVDERLALMMMVGGAVTVMIITSATDPQLLVTLKVYVVVLVGFATGFGHVVQLKLVAGAHKKVPLPDPFNIILEPRQIETSAPAFIVGEGITVTDTLVVFLHPLALVPVTVYAVVIVGLTVMPLVVCPLFQL